MNKGYPQPITREASIVLNDRTFLCIIGKYSSGYFVALPEWEIAAELTNSTSSNALRIAYSLINSTDASGLMNDEAILDLAKSLAVEITPILKQLDQ